MTDPNTTWAEPEAATRGRCPSRPSFRSRPRPSSSRRGRAAASPTRCWWSRRSSRSAASPSPSGGRPPRPPRRAASRAGSRGPAWVRAGASIPARCRPARTPAGFGDRTMTITGTVKSLDGSTLVLTTADGTETTIDVSGSTYHAQPPATSADVTAGTSVSVSVDGVRRGAPSRRQRRPRRERRARRARRRRSHHGHRRDDHVQVGELLGSPPRTARHARPRAARLPVRRQPGRASRARRLVGDDARFRAAARPCLPRPSPGGRRRTVPGAQPGRASRARRLVGDDARFRGAVTVRRRPGGVDPSLVAARSHGEPLVVEFQAPLRSRKSHKPQVSSPWSTPGRHPPLATCATEERSHGKHQLGTPDCGSAA